MSKRPATIATLETFVNEFRALTGGQTAAYRGTELP
jgi:hypothetical protein